MGILVRDLGPQTSNPVPRNFQDPKTLHPLLRPFESTPFHRITNILLIENRAGSHLENEVQLHLKLHQSNRLEGQ